MNRVSWAQLVDMLVVAKDTVFRSVSTLFRMFLTPFGILIDADTGASSWFTSIISWIADLFGLDFLNMTPLEFMLGSTLPLIIVFTVYRYIKQ